MEDLENFSTFLVAPAGACTFSEKRKVPSVRERGIEKSFQIGLLSEGKIGMDSDLASRGRYPEAKRNFPESFLFFALNE